MLPKLSERKPKRSAIINVSSGSANLELPHFNFYGASKAFIQQFS